MDKTNKGMLHGGLNPGRPRTLSRLSDVGADVWLRARFTDLADEDVDSAEGDRVPVLDCAALGAPTYIADVELAATTLGHPDHSTSLNPFQVSLQELETIVCWPHGGRQLSWNCHIRCPSRSTYSWSHHN